MKKVLPIILFIFLIASKTVDAQTVVDTIQIKKSTFGTVYLKDGESIKEGKKLYKILKLNPETYAEISLAKTNNVFGSIFGGAGGFIIGYNLASIQKRNTTWTPFIISFGLIGLSVPFSFGSANHIKKAVLIYNKGMMQTSKNKPIYKLGISNNGIGLKINF